MPLTKFLFQELTLKLFVEFVGNLTNKIIYFCFLINHLFLNKFIYLRLLNIVSVIYFYYCCVSYCSLLLLNVIRWFLDLFCYILFSINNYCTCRYLIWINTDDYTKIWIPINISLWWYSTKFLHTQPAFTCFPIYPFTSLLPLVFFHGTNE